MTDLCSFCSAESTQAFLLASYLEEYDFLVLPNPQGS